MKPIDILGGESVYCINEDQLRRSLELAESDPESSPKIQGAIDDLESRLSRNERAALAFVLIDRLTKTTPSS
jgi:hypothetical protein